MDQAYAVGVRALPVTMVVALFAGMILALQTGIELQKLGQGNMIGTITSLSMCREMGPFMTALILAATVGSCRNSAQLKSLLLHAILVLVR